MNIYEKIKYRRELLGLTIDDVAKHLGVNKSTISRYESEQIKKMPIDFIEPLASILQCTPEYLMGWDDNSDLIPITIIPDVWRIPIVTNVLASCGDGDFADEVILDYISMPANVFKRNRHKQYFAQIADGDSMINAGIEDGDVLVFESCDVPEDNVIGVFCVDNDKCFCKRYKFSNGKVYLLSANDNYLPKEFEPERVRMIGVLKWICKEYELVGK